MSVGATTTTSRDTDVGLVPLLHFSGACRMSPRWRLLLEFEGLAGGPGRIEDVALEFVYDVSKRWSVTGGHRTVEGGTDIDEPYSITPPTTAREGDSRGGDPCRAGSLPSTSADLVLG